LYNENPAIVAGFHKGFADEEKTNKNQRRMSLFQRLPCVKGAGYVIIRSATLVKNRDKTIE
jgi:hypothetical protein